MTQRRPFDIALSEMGQTEIKGSEDNPRIVEYFKSTSYWATDDETPWCAAFVNWCLQQGGVARTRSAAALSFIDWGVRTENPTKGDLAVFDYGRGRGHVGFYVGTKGAKIGVLGGNQGDTVSIKWYPRASVRQFRTSKRLRMSKTAAASTLGVSTSTISAVLGTQSKSLGIMDAGTEGASEVMNAIEAGLPVLGQIPSIGVYLVALVPILTSVFVLWDRHRRLKLHNN